MSLQRVTHQIVEIPITCAVTTANRTLTQRFRPVVAVELKKKGNEKQFGCKKKVPARNRHKNGYVHRQEKINLIIRISSPKHIVTVKNPLISSKRLWLNDPIDCSMKDKHHDDKQKWEKLQNRHTFIIPWQLDYPNLRLSNNSSTD